MTLLNEYAQDGEWVANFDAELSQLEIRSDTFLQAINLLWNLCESSTLALEAFNQSQLTGSFIRCLDHSIFGLDIAISVAQCLLVVSEGNQKIWNVLTQHVPEILSLLNVTGNYGHQYLRTLGAGILIILKEFTILFHIYIFIFKVLYQMCQLCQQLILATY